MAMNPNQQHISTEDLNRYRHFLTQLDSQVNKVTFISSSFLFLFSSFFLYRHQFINIAQNVLWIILLNYLLNFFILNAFIVNVSCLYTNSRVSAFVPKLNNSYSFRFRQVKI